MNSTNLTIKKIFLVVSLLAAFFYSTLTVAHAQHRPVIQRDDIVVRPSIAECFTAPVCSELPKTSALQSFDGAKTAMRISPLVHIGKIFTSACNVNTVNNKSPPFKLAPLLLFN